MKNKQLFFLLVILFSIFISCSDNDDNIVNSQKKYLAEITITEYPWKFGEKSNSGVLYEHYQYNSIGKLVSKETNHYDSYTVTRWNYKYKYNYDDNNCLTSMIESQNGPLYNTYIYKYTTNSFDSIATMDKYYESGGLMESWEYTYDNQKRLLQAKETYNSWRCYVDDYSYEGNTITKVRHFVDNDELFGTTVETYDNHNNLLTRKWINGETGKVDDQIFNTYEYNSNGQLIKVTKRKYRTTSDFNYEDYTYNEDGSIKSIHLSYSYNAVQKDLDYTYTWQ